MAVKQEPDIDGLLEHGVLWIARYRLRRWARHWVATTDGLYLQIFLFGVGVLVLFVGLMILATRQP